jgi:hypothetical protein
MMNAELREQFRLRILQLIDACGALGMRANTLTIQLNGAGFQVQQRDVDTEVTYLRDKEFLAEVAKAISPELKRWRVTAAGRDFLAEQGLA